MSKNIPDYLELNTGAKMPIIGLGTWRAQKGEVSATVTSAIQAGYRHFDCAAAYANEQEIGEALKNAINQGLVKREELFITSKVFCTHNTPERAIKSFHNTLKNLQLDYIDLFLIHWPVKFEEEQIPELLVDGVINPLIHWSFNFKDTWKTLEEQHKKGLARAIGVSNFTIQQLEDLLTVEEGEADRVVPAANQVEFHPYLNQTELLDYCKAKGIVLTAYSPLGSTFKTEGLPTLHENETVKAIAKEVGKSTAQVLIRWGIQKGNVNSIPKSTNEQRLRDNLNVLDFELSPEQVERLDSFKQHRFINIFPGHFAAAL